MGEDTEEFFNKLRRQVADQPETAEDQAERDQWLAGPVEANDLDTPYAAAVDDNPAYPYESAAERDAIRSARRDRARDPDGWQADADQAWQNFFDSLSGKRAGRRVGMPRFKRKGRSRDSFRLHHDVKNPSIRLDGYRRLRMPRVGSVRMHESGKRLVAKGAPHARGGESPPGGSRSTDMTCSPRTWG